MRLTVGDILHRSSLVTVPETSTIAHLNRVLDEHGISGVPVVDGSGKLVGVVSKTDIIRLISRDLAHDHGFYHLPLAEIGRRIEVGRDICEKQVQEVMERRVHSVTPKHDISTAARIMRNLHIHRLVVLEDNSPVGILTALDILKVIERPELLASFYSGSGK